MISSNSGLMLSYSEPSSSLIGPRWNSTFSMAILGTSIMRHLRSELAMSGRMPETTNFAWVSVRSMIFRSMEAP